MSAGPDKASNFRARWKERAIKLLIFSVSSLICLLLLEWFVRIAFPYYHPGRQLILRLNEEGVVVGKPGSFRLKTVKGDYDTTVTFNHHGFRDSKDFKLSTTNDIFVAGDSFSVGYGIEESERFSNLLEKQPGLRLFNLAIPEDLRGYNATVSYARRHGAKINHLIIGLCMENDLWDYTNPESTHARFGRDMNPGRMRAVWNWFKARSALWLCASHLIQGTSAGRVLFEKLGIAKNVEALTHQNTYSPVVLTSTRDELLQLATNYHSVVLIIPSRGLWHGQNLAREEKVHEEFVKLLREAGLSVVDMRPVFEKTGRPLQFYFAHDPHWNAAGHRAAAEELARYLGERRDWPGVPGRPDTP